ncbi:hypothetical protein DIZ81_02105 [Legionella taurinensis]|uniref:Uncharacterized protein n=1 Tax=Legionella taurinensis TaxID=70611 RepID=A0A3A5LC66_9GAMM|nr:hypothetical protein [Legionella taurinensis]MDX1836336.1 hypothetical protein [Legionella taurinensis]PUT41913.1 hypothetical protein DB744_02110 [Legionella taurinensis]PUT44702.1 hypothetical protein DB746_02110 [Legionella taurinensis]PUT48022.1 hypothetical protein DB743_00270 [Legionella taurinensis]PUT48836.1 hypothetical protein DB745_02110 [Legionella taurinensis]
MQKLKLRTVYMTSLLLASPLVMTGCDTMQSLMGGSSGRDDTTYHSSSSASVTTYDRANAPSSGSSTAGHSSSSSAAASNAPNPSGQSITTKPAVPMSAPTVGQ